jgi:hypothetical protein
MIKSNLDEARDTLEQKIKNMTGYGIESAGKRKTRMSHSRHSVQGAGRIQFIMENMQPEHGTKMCSNVIRIHTIANLLLLLTIRRTEF